MSKSKPRLSIIGLGKLGACMAAVFARAGHTVIGVDVNQAAIDALEAGLAPVEEPQLSEMIRDNAARLSATSDLKKAVKDTDVSFIIVPTPSDDQGIFSLRYASEVARGIGEALRNKAGYHLVVVTSTVMPGHTGGELRQLIEDASGKRMNKDFGLCYSPEFIALGSVIRDMSRPDFLLIGSGDERAGDMLESILIGSQDKECPVARMNFVNAELTKIAVNTFVTTKISYANMLAQICETLVGADSDVVSSALGLDSRIGSKYLKGALAYGGPCFPRDNVAFAKMARLNGIEAIVAEATDKQNQSQRHHLCQIVRKHLPKSGRVGILGLSYKPDTSVIDCSPGLEICQELREDSVSLVLYDPQAMDNAKKSLEGVAGIEFASSAADCVAKADVIIMTVAWNEFRSLTPAHFKSSGAKKTLIDCWRLFSAKLFEDSIHYVTVGQGPAPTPVN